MVNIALAKRYEKVWKSLKWIIMKIKTLSLVVLPINIGSRAQIICAINGGTSLGSLKTKISGRGGGY